MIFGSPRLPTALILFAAIMGVAAGGGGARRSEDRRFKASMMPRPAVPIVSAPLNLPVVSRNGTELAPYNTTYYFDQLIDHDNPSLGTFKQRYWHTSEFYEPGGPIVIFSPGEGNAEGYDGYLTNRTIVGLIAQQESGSAVVLEHRFYGLSNPLPDLSVKSLRLHTLDQAVEDLVYFAENVFLPQPNGDQLAPKQAPWVLVGGSYSGALTSWTMVKKPGVFYAGYSSSGVVEAIVNFWRYFEPIREAMPKNCSADVQAVISHIDEVFTGSNRTAVNAIKSTFGLSAVTHLNDVAGALRNNLWDWQSLSPTSGADTQFRKFCDALEVKNGVSAPESGWGLDNALAAWGKYWKTGGYLKRICGNDGVEDCLGTYNPDQEYWTDIEVDNAGRSWFWIVCNEVGYLQDGAPIDQPSLVTRLVDPYYDMRQCQMMFPGAFPGNTVPAPVPVEKTNSVYKGWDVNIERLFFANGQRDPWRDATVSAKGLNKNSTPQQPIAISDGFHCSDLSTRIAAVDPTVQAVHVQALASMRSWLSGFKPEPAVRPTQPQPPSSPGFADLPPPRHGASKPLSAWTASFGSFDGNVPGQ